MGRIRLGAERPLHLERSRGSMFTQSPLGIWVPATSCIYELLARFNVANQGFADGQVLGAAEGVNVGTLEVDEPNSTIEILDRVCRMTGSGTDNYANGLFEPDGITRALGKALLGKALSVGSLSYWYIGWSQWQFATSPTAHDHAIGTTTTGGQGTVWTDGGADLRCWVPAADVEYEAAIVLGGYDVNERPWYDGVVGSFLYGASYFVRGGVYTDWTLVYRHTLENTAILYPTFGNRDIVNRVVEYDDLRVPVYDYSAALEPVNADWFTDPNGTSLDAHTPNVGGAWVEYSGDWDIQGNQARQSVSGGATHYSSAVESSESDLFGRVTVTVPAVDNGAAAFAYRLSDANNFWMAMALNTGGADTFVIREYNGGVVQTRATVGVAIAQGQTVEITMIADGQNMQAFMDGANRITFASVFNQAATKHGLAEYRSNVSHPNDNAYDNFHVNRRDGTQYDVLDNCA